jgi:hypothetical protein
MYSFLIQLQVGQHVQYISIITGYNDSRYDNIHEILNYQASKISSKNSRFVLFKDTPRRQR